MEDGMKALALVDTPEHVCCRYRIKAFEPALNRAGWSLTTLSLAHPPVQRLLQFLDAARHDVVILQRKLLPRWQLWALRQRARRLVFDFDDAVLYRDSYDPRGPDCPRRARRFAATVRAADLVVAGNDFLADCALRAGASADRVRVIPTCINTERYPSTEIRESKPVSGGLNLVWIGSSSTLKGLELRRSLWDRVGREVPGARLRVICDRFPDLGALPVVAIPWSESTETSELAAADVGVSWVPDDDWSRGKCGLKVLQYQASGLPVIANPVGVHTEMIRPGVNGWLPETPEGWVEAARDLASDPERRRRMGQAAREAVVTGYSVSAWEGTFVEEISGGERIDCATPPIGARFHTQAAMAAQFKGRAGRGSIGAKG